MMPNDKNVEPSDKSDETPKLKMLLDKKDWDGALVWLHERYADDVRTWVRVRTKDNREDINQQVWAGARKGLPNYKSNGRHRAWLYVITSNRLKTYYRDQQKVPIPTDVDAESAGRILVSLPAGFGPQRERSPLDQVLRRERTSAVMDAISKWSEEDRELFVLRFAFEFMPQELADIVSARNPNPNADPVDPNAMAQQLHRLLVRLRTTLMEHEAFSSLKRRR